MRKLHQDNAPSHTMFVTREFLAKNNITTIDHSPYLPILYLTPYNFYLFPKVKNIMRDEHFVAVDKTRNDEAPKGTDKGRHAALPLEMREALDQVYSVKGRVLQG